MSISYELYNADPQFSEMWKWESDHFLPIGEISSVIDKINRLFEPRELSWEVYEYDNDNVFLEAHSVLAKNWDCHSEEEYIDITVFTHKEGYVCEISARKASPLLVQMLLKEFDLKYVCEVSSCKLIDPFKYTGNWKPIENENY